MIPTESVGPISGAGVEGIDPAGGTRDMGLGFALGLHGVLFAILLAAFALAAALIAVALPARRPLVRLLLRLAPWLLAGLPVVALAISVTWIAWAPPALLYRFVFGVMPDATVAGLRAAAEGSNDGKEVFLAFSASDETLRDLASRFRDAGDGVDLVPLPGAEPPPWWLAAACRDRSVATAARFGRWDEVVVTYCRATRTAYVQARWID